MHLSPHSCSPLASPSLAPSRAADYVSLAQRCWQPLPSDRPTFAQIVQELDAMRQAVSMIQSPVIGAAPPPDGAMQASSPSGFGEDCAQEGAARMQAHMQGHKHLSSIEGHSTFICPDQEG